MLTMKDLLVTHLEYSFEKEGWQPPLWMAVQGLTAEQGAWKPSPERHSIWQIVRHVVWWKRGVLKAWAGDPPSNETLVEEDWKEVKGTQAEWVADVNALRETYEEFRSRLLAADEEGLQRTLRWYEQAGQSQAVGLRLIHVFSHDLYHAGQIQYLRALQELPTDRFYTAAVEGNVARMTEVLGTHPDLLNSPDRDGWTALHLAAYFGRLEAVRFLLNKGAVVRGVSKNARAATTLHTALSARRTEIATLLLERGADLEATAAEGNTPLHAAAEAGSPEAVELLVGRGANVNPRRNDGATPLTIALKAGHSGVADALRQHGGVE